LSETQVQKRKRKKQFTALEQVEEEVAVQNAKAVTEALEELKEQGKLVEIPVCLKCKSPMIERTKSAEGDMWGHMAAVQPKSTCPDCGWQERILIKATNKPLTVKEVELIREAMEIEEEAAK
jgi:DNA-directed RNA polymerase subunit RPC12/RpoP